MTALQSLDQAELEFRSHCRANCQDPQVVYGEDSTRIEDMAKKIVALAVSLAADFRKLHTLDNPNPTPMADIARLVAESIDRDMNLEAARLLYAAVAYWVSVAEGAK